MTNLFSRIFLRTNPPAEGIPEGSIALEVEAGRLVAKNASGAWKVVSLG